MQWTAIILCGGRGLRAGGRDKGLLPVYGRPMIQQVLESIGPRAASIVISANRNRARYAELGHTVVADTIAQHQGPLAGLQAALAICDTPLVAVLPCDMPLLPADTVPRLIAGLGDAELCFARDGERDQYLVAVMRRDIRDNLDRFLASGGRAVHRWYATLDTVTVDFSNAADKFQQFNAPQDVDAQRRP